MLVRRFRALTLAAALFILAAGAAAAQTKAPAITTPKQQFGFNIGDDYQLATYAQFTEYWQKLDKESTRMQVIEIGKTEEGRPHLAAIITAPENFAKLDRYKAISQQLHRARGLTDDQARALAKEGKSVVWIDGGLHATEVVGAHQLMETVYQLVSRTDDETTRILRDVIVIAVHANPDGMQMVSKCYMQNADPLQRRTCSPRLYNKYAGHDNNRDFYMSNTKESQNMNKLMYWEWLPQIMYNHHQSGPAGTVIFSPPFRDPFNYNFDPMIVTGLDMVGAAHAPPLPAGRQARFHDALRRGLFDVVERRAADDGVLPEHHRPADGDHRQPDAVADPGRSPSQILPRADLPAPIEPQTWHFRQSIDYSVTANYAVLDLASRYKDQFLFNIYRMGANQIERGSRDHWTISNEDMARLQAAMAGPAAANTAAPGGGRGGRGGGPGNAAAAPAAAEAGAGRRRRGGRGGIAMATYNAVFKDPARRDPRAYVIPADQADSPTATKFINTLRYIGVEILQATAPVTVGGKTYPKGSYVVKTAQAGRAHVIDMFEPQDHPNDMDERGIPRRPVRQRRLDALLPDGREVRPGLGRRERPAAGDRGPGGADPRHDHRHHERDRGLPPVAVDQRLLHHRQPRDEGQWRGLAARRADDRQWQDLSGRHACMSRPAPPRRRSCRKARRSSASTSDATSAAPTGATRLAPRRIALWDTATGSMPSGWTRYLLERFEFPFTHRLRRGFRRHGAAIEVRRDRHAVGRGVPSGAAAAGAAAVAGGAAAVTPSRPQRRRPRRRRPIPICAASAR